MIWRSFARRAAYRTGTTALLHHMRDHDHLTVVMFHRVLPTTEGAKVAADSNYTVTPEILAGCLEFFRDQYNLVALNDVLESRRGNKPLPRWPLLITFDDGWRDNFEWARPILQDIPWTLFVAADAAREPALWWQEVLLWSFRSGLYGYAELVGFAGAELLADRLNLPRELRLLVIYAQISAERRRDILSAAMAELSSRYEHNVMLSASEIRRLHSEGVAIGSHAAAHLPLTSIPNATSDMRRGRDELCAILSSEAISAISFPHGRWNELLLGDARALGHELQFTSDPTLNSCPAGWLISDTIGRISMDISAFNDLRGRIARDRLANWLQNRKRTGIQVLSSA